MSANYYTLSYGPKAQSKWKNMTNNLIGRMRDHDEDLYVSV